MRVHIPTLLFLNTLSTWTSTNGKEISLKMIKKTNFLPLKGLVVSKLTIKSALILNYDIFGHKILLSKEKNPNL